MKYQAPLFFILLIVCAEARGQGLYDGIPSPFFASSSHGRIYGRSVPKFSPDRQQHYKPKSMPLNTVAGSPYQADMYWMSSMTTQSYNQGKIGRFYLWDVQGNLRESKMFFDIAGKNKRGLKLVFSKFRF